MLLSRDRLEVYLPVYEAETASGSQAQPFPAEIQLKRLINAASKNEMAASGTKFFARNTAVVAENPTTRPIRPAQKLRAQVFSLTVRVAAA